ncbi:MAG: cupredoxin domain-containing protein [Thaumarchaeota archaeon]|nr:cupredoxin domain-containing protein [Nitrososphaerota archaeon]
MRFTNREIILLAIIVIAGGYGTYYFIAIQIPHVVGITILGIYTDQGYAYKIVPSQELSHCLACPKDTLSFSQGTTIALSFINNDNVTHSIMDFNIDDFNIHSKTLTPIDSQNFYFLVDKQGTFTYYSKLHPDMNGTITVIPNFLPGF